MTEVITKDYQPKVKSTPLLAYITGFVFSVLLTVDAYIATAHHVFAGQLLVFLLAGLALVQLIVQLIFFLHIGQDKSSRWNLIFLLSTVGIISIMVVGSLWIMYNLNYRMVAPIEINQYLQSQDGF